MRGRVILVFFQVRKRRQQTPSGQPFRWDQSHPQSPGCCKLYSSPAPPPSLSSPEKTSARTILQQVPRAGGFGESPQGPRGAARSAGGTAGGALPGPGLGSRVAAGPSSGGSLTQAATPTTLTGTVGTLGMPAMARMCWRGLGKLSSHLVTPEGVHFAP